MRTVPALVFALVSVALNCASLPAQTLPLPRTASLVGRFPGDTPPPASLFDVPASLIVTRSAPPGGLPDHVVPALYTHLETDPESRSYEWANLAILTNRSNHGENVASYAQARKLGGGPTWGGVFELQDHTGTGGFFGLEIDAFTQGQSPFPGSQQGDRIGLGIILGRAGNTGPTATVDYGILLAPSRLDDTQANVNFGVMVASQCRFACFAMRGGNKLAWEESAQIASRFDPATGRWGLFNGDRPLFEIDVNTGELRVNGRAVQISYKD